MWVGRVKTVLQAVQGFAVLGCRRDTPSSILQNVVDVSEAMLYVVKCVCASQCKTVHCFVS